MPYQPDADRYEVMPYRRCGESGILLPAVTLGLWQNFGASAPYERVRTILTRAFDLGVNHFDLANNYGPPPGHAEEVFGRVLATDLGPFREELFISSKAGYDMWEGPYGVGGSRKYLLSSLEASLRRMGLETVDLFYSHRYDPDTPLAETMGALASAVHQGKARYVGISSYSPQKTREAAALLREDGVRPLIHQPSYSLLNRWIEDELLDVLAEEGMGCIGFSALAQGLLTEKYLDGVPEDSRAAADGSFRREWLTEETLEKVRGLAQIAADRGQTLAQMAIAWTLRDERVSSALIGASSVSQLEENVAATHNLAFDDGELETIDDHARSAGIDLWADSRKAG